MDTRKQAVNTFSEGLMMDLNPLTTPNNVLTNCLNGTLITNNGNEFILQNDLGNGRVETAFLPAGYVPIGTKEFGGIVYVASYNPITDKGQLGSFPSPERNITSEELSSLNQTIKTSDFGGGIPFKLRSMYLKKDLLSSDNLIRPGDQFLVACDGLDENISTNTTRKLVKLHLAIIDTNNNLTYIENDLPTVNGHWLVNYDSTLITESGSLELDSYRGIVDGTYYTYKNKISGKLAIVAELESIETFNSEYKLTIDENNQADILFSWSWDEEVTDYLKLAGIKFTVNNDTYYLNTVSDTKSMQAKLSQIVKSGFLNYEATPYMSYGELTYLKKIGSLNLDAIGSGEIDLTEWRYYIDTNTTISWGLNCYPKPGKEVSNVIFNFIDLNRTSDGVKIYNCKKRNSYNGNFTEVISSDNLNLNTLYLVKIQVDQVNSDDITTGLVSTYFYRLLYTTPLFNQYYLQDIDDFGAIQLTGNISIDSSINVVGSLNKNIKVTYPSTGLTSFNSTLTNGLSEIHSDFTGDYKINLDINLSNSNNLPFTFNEEAITVDYSIQTSNIVNDSISYLSTGVLSDLFKVTLDPDNFTRNDNVVDTTKQYYKVTDNNDFTFSVKGKTIRKVNSTFKNKTINEVIKTVSPYLSITNTPQRRQDLLNIFGQEGAVILPSSSSDDFHFSKAVGLVQTARKNDKSLYMASALINIERSSITGQDVIAEYGQLDGELNNTGSNAYRMFIEGAKKYFGASVIVPVTGIDVSVDGVKGNENGDRTQLYQLSAKNRAFTFVDTDYLEGGSGIKDRLQIAWKTTEIQSADNPSYGYINYFGRRQTNYDQRTGWTYSYAHPLMCLLNQVYLAKWTTFNKTLSKPDTVYYTDNAKTKYPIKLVNNQNTIGNNLFTITIGTTVYDFSNVDAFRTVFNTLLGVTLTNAEWLLLKPNLPSYNNFEVTLNSGDSINIENSIDSSEVVETYLQDFSLDNLLAVSELNGAIFSTDSSGNLFDESKLYWYNRSTNKFDLLTNEMFLYNDSFNVAGDTLSYLSTTNTTLFETTTKKINIGKFLTVSNTLSSDKTTRNELLLNHNALSSSTNIAYHVAGMSGTFTINGIVFSSKFKGPKIYSVYITSKDAPVKLT